MSVLFTILFKKNNGDTFSASFNNHIESTCKLKYLDLDGKIHDLKYWNRTLNENSTISHIIHDATEINEANLCTLENESKCNAFFKEANMSILANNYNCCSFETGTPDGCTQCLQGEAYINDINTNRENIRQTKGYSMSFDLRPTILLNGNNLFITDGTNADRILLDKTIDSSNNMYINSKLYEQQKNIENCPSPQSVCPQIFDGSKSTMSILDQKCCHNDPEDCKTCFNNLAKKYKMIYTYNFVAFIGSSIRIDNMPTVLLKDKNLVITDGSNAIAVELSFNL